MRVFSCNGASKRLLKEQLEEQVGSTFYQSPSIPRMRWRDAFEDLTQVIHKMPKEKKIILFFFLMSFPGWYPLVLN